MKLLKFAGLFAVGMFIIGCGKSMPSCSGEDTKDLLEKIVHENTSIQDISFSGFATNKTDKAKKQVTCQAIAEITHSKGNLEKNICHYKARYTDDNQLYVEITGCEKI